MNHSLHCASVSLNPKRHFVLPECRQPYTIYLWIGDPKMLRDGIIKITKALQEPIRLTQLDLGKQYYPQNLN